jgi:dUTP pyrophosphatase
MMKLNVKVKKVNKDIELPAYATMGSAGVDLRASITEPITVHAGETVVVPTGLAFEIPPNYEMQLRPRSGLAKNYNVTLMNSPATIDSDFRGEVGVLLHLAPTQQGILGAVTKFLQKFGILKNAITEQTFVIYPNDRIAQAVFTSYETVMFTEVEELSTTERGDGAYGHSGVK